mmetsp:Transcript_7099/g.7633  ORF Transcript_7099/g.7633 Transcript_7099/m.7633 type:complete len:114 (-) Transcript_7099:31-372(-)
MQWGRCVEETYCHATSQLPYLPASTLAGLIPKSRALVAARPIVVPIVEPTIALVAQVVAQWMQWGRCVEETHCHATSQYPIHAATLAGLIPKPRAHVAAPPIVVTNVELAIAT